MSVSEWFEEFCKNLRMSDSTVNTIVSRYHQITKRINTDYYNSSSETNNSLYVGSYGRGTEIYTSDIDMLVKLPYETYVKYNNYSSNGQSALLQEVKNILAKTYSTSSLKGDGQIVSIPFYDGINFEVLPAFINEDNISYTYANSNNGGNWKTTDPKSEISAINAENTASNKNLKRLCRMARAWKEKCNVPISGILIDTLAYKFMQNWGNKDKTYLYYDYMSRDFFEFLKNIESAQSYWKAPGSNRYAYKSGDFQSKAKTAYQKSLDAINADTNKYYVTAKSTWREIYGTKFPS